ncbi:MAG TPA: PA2779 family protein [Terriglobales bacterium]|nr:PA2779 family protein [Terriglobales bacterium]
MFLDRAQWVRICAASVLSVLFALPINLMAETSHLVSPSELQKEAVNVSQTRQQNITTVQKFLSGERAEKAMQSLHANPTQVRAAVANLSDQELAKLASKATNAERDFAAGHLSRLDDLLIIAGVVLIIIIVVATR